jgi:hypothetical protein
VTKPINIILYILGLITFFKQSRHLPFPL